MVAVFTSWLASCQERACVYIVVDPCFRFIYPLFVVSMPSGKRETERKVNAPVNTGPSPNSDERVNNPTEGADESARGSSPLHQAMANDSESESNNAQSDFIQLRVVSQDSKEVTFRVKMDMPLIKLMKAYSERTGIGLGSGFVFDGSRVDDTKTPKELNMADNDMIDVYQQQTNNHLEGWHNRLIRKAGENHNGFYELLQLKIAEQGVMDTVIQQALPGNMTVGGLRRLYKVYTQKQRQVAQYTGEYTNGRRTLEQFLEAVIFLRVKSIIDHKAAVLGVNLNPQTIICDFEAGLTSLIQGYFPNTRVHGCYFHFSKAVHRKVGELELNRN
ncbi:Small ubiquitin-related modifier [Trichinella sp. T6]|nr:Small ubiquitin-related modifier [Trichinella sp. T6]